MADNTWRVRDMDADTIKKIKWYAIQNNLTMADALKALTERALQVDELLLGAFDKAAEDEDPLVVKSIRSRLIK